MTAVSKGGAGVGNGAVEDGSAGCSKSLERLFEEAQLGGQLTLRGRRLRHFPHAAADPYDLTDCHHVGKYEGKLVLIEKA